MPKFVKFEFPTSSDDEWTMCLTDAGVFRSRREQLQLSQQEVADRAKIDLKQYQALEAGNIDIDDCDLKSGLAVCAVLLLDPKQICGVNINTSETIQG